MQDHNSSRRRPAGRAKGRCLRCFTIFPIWEISVTEGGIFLDSSSTNESPEEKMGINVPSITRTTTAWGREEGDGSCPGI